MKNNKQLTFTYTNYKGEKRERVVIPERIYYGSTQFHKDEQWLMVAVDCETGNDRTFAMKDIKGIG